MFMNIFFLLLNILIISNSYYLILLFNEKIKINENKIILEFFLINFELEKLEFIYKFYLNYIIEKINI